MLDEENIPFVNLLKTNETNNELTNNINNTNEIINETLANEIINETLTNETNNETNKLTNKNSSNIKKEDVFDFIKNPRKIELLIKTNELLNVNKNEHNKLLFVYSNNRS